MSNNTDKIIMIYVSCVCVCVCVCIVVSNIHCAVLCFVLFRIVYPKLSASLDCHFWIALWYSLTFSKQRPSRISENNFSPSPLKLVVTVLKWNNIRLVCQTTLTRLLYLAENVGVQIQFGKNVSLPFVNNKYGVPYFLHSDK
jgi:hypothetical protein